MKKWLTAMGFDCSRPMGAFYIFAKIPDFLEQDDAKLVYDLVKNARVAVTAGSYLVKVATATCGLATQLGWIRLKKEWIA